LLFPDKRHPYFKKVFDYVREHDVPGDYLEFGVFRGQSFIMAYQLGHDLDMRFFAFDSFQGLPRDEESWKRGQFRADTDYFLRSVRKAGADLDRVVLVPGYYEELSLSDVPGLQRAAVIHIDCDLYSSTREALRLVEGIIGKGTMVIFDDWFLFDHRPNPAEHGEQRAFLEWKEAHRFEPFQEAVRWHKSFICTG
jgi:O-methyltransferase